MNVRDIITQHGLPVEDEEIATKLQEYVDETEHEGAPLPPENAIPQMYDFALYIKLSSEND